MKIPLNICKTKTMGSTTQGITPDLGMDVDIEKSRSGESGVEPIDKQANGLAQHLETARTPEDIRVERRYLLKVDFMILPILALTLFLASLVFNKSFSLTSTFADGLNRIVATQHTLTSPEWETN